MTKSYATADFIPGSGFQVQRQDGATFACGAPTTGTQSLTLTSVTVTSMMSGETQYDLHGTYDASGCASMGTPMVAGTETVHIDS